MPSLPSLCSLTDNSGLDPVEGRPAARCDACGQSRAWLDGRKLLCAVCIPPPNDDVSLYVGVAAEGRLRWQRVGRQDQPRPRHALYVEIDTLACFRVAADAPFGDTFEVVDEPWQGVEPGRYVRLTPKLLEKLGKRHNWEKERLLPVAVEAYNCGLAVEKWFSRSFWEASEPQ